MSTTLTTRIGLVLHATLVDADPFSGGVSQVRVDQFMDWANGSGTDQAALVLSREVVVPGGATVLFLLGGGSIVTALGDTVTFTSAKAIYVRNTHATRSVTLGGSLGLLAGISTVLGPGEMLLLVNPAGSAVTAQAGTVALEATAGVSVTVELVVIGS